MIRIDDALGSRTPNNRVYPTICVDGRGASGKTALADFLVRHIEGATVIHGDDYFEPHDHAITWGDFNETRFDADVLSRIRAGHRAITLRPFDFPNGRLGAAHALKVGRVLLVERWFAMSLDVPWDLTIWVETPREVCLARGLARPGTTALGSRGRAAWETVWQPREDTYLRMTSPRLRADYVVDGTAAFETQFDFARA